MARKKKPVEPDGGRINGIFFHIGAIKDMYSAGIVWREEYMLKYSGRRRLPVGVKRYIKAIDYKLDAAKKIIEEYDKKQKTTRRRKKVHN